jgi:RNA polymerase sigma-70 factor (ECF subfamily)
VRVIAQSYCRAKLSRLPGGSDSAEDAVQDVCVAVLRALPRYVDTGRPFEAFVQTIASRRVVDVIRASRRLPVLVAELPDGADEAPTPDVHAVHRDEVGRARRLMAALSDQHRELLQMRLEDGMSAEEVGDVLAMTPGAVRVAQHRAIRRLRSLAQTETTTNTVTNTVIGTGIETRSGGPPAAAGPA